jgi:hypothetical protein
MPWLRRLLPLFAVLVWLAAIVAVAVGIRRGDLLYSSLVAMPGYGTVGLLLGIRRPTHPIGWVLLAMATLPVFAAFLLLAPEVVNGLAISGLAVVLVVFPTGRPLSVRWLIPMWAAVVSWVFLWRLPIISLAGGFEVHSAVVAAAASLLVCSAAPLVRFRRSVGIERAQLRWLGAAVALFSFGLILMGIGLGAGVEWAQGLGGEIAVTGVGFGLPIAILVAILRYRLYDIGRIVSRTVTYAAVALVVSAVYAIPVLLIPEALGASSDLVTAGATLAAATAFNPVRRRVRAVVDRRFNRSAYDAAREVDRLAMVLRDEVDIGAVSHGLATTASRALQPGSVAVWLRQGN